MFIMGAMFKLQSSKRHPEAENCVKKKSKEAKSCNHKTATTLENTNVSKFLFSSGTSKDSTRSFPQFLMAFFILTILQCLRYAYCI